MKKRKVFRRSLLCAVLAVLMASSSILCYAEDTGPLVGDIDGDGELSSADALSILKMACDIEPCYDLSVADYDGDGIISSYDAVQVLAIAATGLPFLEKTGDNIITDDPNNKFIAFVVKKYSVNAAALVAIYTDPESDSNFVLQFKKKSLTKYGRSPDDLEAVYCISADLTNVSKTKGSLLGTGNENCTAAEGYMVFLLVKKDIMPQHPDVFTNVD